MDKKLYKLMNWPEIEGIIYSECDNPYDTLGQHITPSGILIQTFMPGASCVVVHADGASRNYTMEEVDENGFFAVLIPGRKKLNYTLFITFPNGKSREIRDPYSYEYPLDYSAVREFMAGINYNAYKLLGAHITKIGNVSGVRFAIWAPDALRVSVVGDFNDWDGRIHQMEKDPESGIFYIFIPEIWEGSIYKYEIKYRGDVIVLKSDPYGFYFEAKPDAASIVYNIDNFKWEDSVYIKERDRASALTSPVSIYRLHPALFNASLGKDHILSYRELASDVCKYVSDMNYTHVELMDVTALFAPDSTYGSPVDFKYFINELHKAGIGVIADWSPAHFDAGDISSGIVRNMLIASAFFWALEYHIDGLFEADTASMLYLDYGKNPGEWQPNIYGGSENLNAIELIKHMNSIFKKKGLSTMLIAEDSSAWPMVTGDVSGGSLGFDFKWNTGWDNDFTGFMAKDPLFRKGSYGDLSFSIVYNYSENFMLGFFHDDITHDCPSIIDSMPGDNLKDKTENLRAAYGYMFMHPGKKLLSMNRDSYDKEFNDYIRDLNAFYRSHPALYDMDYNPDGFRWINCISADETIVVFERIAQNGEELIIVANFTPVKRANYKIGVPHAGKYKEIFNSDSSAYGGSDFNNPRLKVSKKDECDGFEDSVRIKVPPMGISVFRYIPVSEGIVVDNATARKNIKKSRKEK